MPRNPLPSLTYLGRPTPAPTTPDEAVLDRVPNPHDDAPYVVRFSAPEFTVLCAVTGQPDFAHIVIDYVPKAWLIESKSLKFYLASFRNHSGFHEECTIDIGKRLAAVLEPAYLRIGGYWYPVEACQSMCFGERECCQPTYGYPSRGSLPIGAADNVARGSTGNFCTRKVASRLMSVDLSYCDANRMFDLVERAPVGSN